MRVKPDQQKPGLNPTLTHAHTFQLRMLLELEGPFKTVKDRILEASQNMINCLVSNIYNKLKYPALLSHLFRTEKSAGKFQFVVEIAHNCLKLPQRNHH